MRYAYLIHAPSDWERLPLLTETLGNLLEGRERALILVPTDERARQLRALLPSEIPRRVVPFQQFLAEQQVPLLRHRPLLSPEEEVVLVHEVLQQVPLGFLRRLPRTWRLAASVHRVLSLVRRASDFPLERRQIFRELSPDMPQAAEALAQVDVAYIHALTAYALADRERLRQELVEHWQTRAYVGPYDVLVIDGFSFFFTPVQRLVFATLMAIFEKVIVTLAAPRGGLEALEVHRGYENVLHAYRWLREQELNWREIGPRTHAQTLLAEVQERLFTEQTEPLPRPSPESSPLRLIAAPNPREEIRWIARQIRLDLARGGRPAQHTLVVIDPECYLPLLREIFREYGLEGPVPYLEKLSQIPVVVLIRRWIEGCLGTWEPNALYAVLASPWVNFPQDRIERLEAQRRAANVRHPFDLPIWYEAIERMLRQRYLSGAVESEDRHADRERYEQELAQAHQDLQQVEAYLERGQSLGQAQTPAAFAHALRRSLRDIGLEQAVFSLQDDRPETLRNRQAYRKFQETLSQVVRLLERIAPPGDAVRLCQEYLLYRLEQTFCATIPYRQRGIRVMRLDEAASVRHDHLYLPGCVEGKLPTRDLVSFLIRPDAPERVAIPGLDSLREERFLFQQILGNSRHVVLTYPKLVEGQEQVPSPFLEELRVLFDGEEAGAHGAIGPLTEQEPLLSIPEVLQAMGQADQAAGWERLGLPWGNVNVQLQAERLRSDRTRFSIYDGWLDPSTARQVWEELCERSYASTLLERYARCPMRFFFQDVLHLQEAQVLDDEIAPNVRGLLVHRILERFYREHPTYRTRDPALLSEALRALRQLAESEMAIYDREYPNLYWQEERRILLKGMDGEGEPGLLRAWLEVDWDPQNEPFSLPLEPSHMEYRFGRFADASTSAPPLEIPRDSGPPLRIRGKVDRVDQNATEHVFAVYDYKTGSVDSVADIERGLSLQLPIYLLALRANGMGRPVAAAYYQLRRPDEVKRTSYIGDQAYFRKRCYKCYPSEAFEALLERTLQNILAIDRQIQQGRFHPSLWSETVAGCSHCPYARICRYEANRQLNMRLPPGELIMPYGREGS